MTSSVAAASWSAGGPGTTQELLADFMAMIKVRIPPRTGGRGGDSTRTGAQNSESSSILPEHENLPHRAKQVSKLYANTVYRFVDRTAYAK